MNLLALLSVSAGAVFSVIWIIHYIPIMSSKPKVIWLKMYNGKFAFLPKTEFIKYSPRLFACKLLIPFDAGISLFLVFAGMLGLSTAVTGISMMIFNVFTAVGFSIGVWIVYKFLKPRWETEYNKLLQAVK